MRRDMILPGAIVGMALVAVVVGLTVAGGPSRGKVEQRDALRIAQIQKARDHVFCLTRANGGVLPETLIAHPSCNPGDALRDPFTEAPVRYEKLDARQFHLCPMLELAEDHADTNWLGGGNFDAASGCIRYNYRP